MSDSAREAAERHADAQGALRGGERGWCTGDFIAGYNAAKAEVPAPAEIDYAMVERAIGGYAKVAGCGGHSACVRAALEAALNRG